MCIYTIKNLSTVICCYWDVLRADSLSKSVSDLRRQEEKLQFHKKPYDPGLKWTAI